MYLDDLKDRAIRAHSNISHFPERSGANLINELESYLAEDLAFLKELSDFDKTTYIEKFRSLASGYISKVSSCAYAGIVGPAKFDFAKANRKETARWESWDKLQYFRTRAKEKKERETKKANSNANPDETFQFDGFSVVYAYYDDRIRVFHDTKPDADTIAKFKKYAFKWSPSNKCWQRQLTYNGVGAVLLCTGLTKEQLPRIEPKK